MNNRIIALTVAILTCVFLGCSKDDDGGTYNGVVKVTVSTSESFNAASGSSVTASISVSDKAGEFLPVKINGETFSSKIVHKKHDSEFNGGQTYTFESIGDYEQAIVDVRGYSIQSEFTLSYKIEQGTTVIANEVINFTPQSDVYVETYIVKK